MAAFFVFFAAGLDIAGTLSARASDSEQLIHRLGVKRLGTVFVEKPMGKVRLERSKCRGCLTCWDLCPVGVFAGQDAEKKVHFKDPQACFACSGCVKQCPEGALSLDGKSEEAGNLAP